MKKDWEIKKLGEVCIVERGSSPRPIEKYQTNSPEGVNWIKIGDTKGVDKYIFITKEKITKEGAEKSRYVKEGDFILSNSMSFGKPYIMKTDGYIHDGWFVFRLPDYLDKDYFYYLLTSPNVQEQIQSLGAGAIVKNISGDLVKKVDITYPKSLPEQGRIVSILDEAFACIERSRNAAMKNLKNAKELFESYLETAFENKVHGEKFETLDSLCELIVDCEHKTAPTQETGYPSIRTPNIGKGELILQNVNRVSYETYIQWTRRAIPKAGDLILAREAPAGNIAVIPENIEVCLGQRTVLLRPKKDRLISKYLAYLILSKEVQEILLSHSTGATVQHINMKDIRAFKIYNLSDLKEQISVVQKLDALKSETKKLEVLYQKKIADLEELKKSILQKAFAGEL